jgi:hypothetical protein
MQDTNWDLIKFKYELLGASLEDLAAEHSVSLAVLQYNSKNWHQISLGQNDLVDIKDVNSIDDVLVKLSKQTLNQTQAFLILKQKFLGPKMMELENILLCKAISLASNINDKDPRAASTLKSITEVLINLIGQNPLLKSGENLSGEGDKVWEIRIVDAPDKKKED